MTVALDAVDVRAEVIFLTLWQSGGHLLELTGIEPLAPAAN
jgi:hypothetical protein